MRDPRPTAGQFVRGLKLFADALAHADRGQAMKRQMTNAEAEQHLLDIAQKAEAIAASHITGMTFHHDDLRKLAKAIRLKIADPVA